MRTSGHYLFHEEQDYRHPVIILMIAVFTLGMVVFQLYQIYRQIYLGQPVGNPPQSNSELVTSAVIAIVVVVSIAIFLLNLRLITEVRYDGFYYRYPVLINKMRMIRKEDIVRYEVGKYHPLKEFGGWGYRNRLGRRKAYSIMGRQGARFLLANGREVLFGTRQPAELKRALDKMMNPSNF